MSNAQGNILEDEELIDTLSRSKATSVEISVKVEEAAKTEAEIDHTRNAYRGVATHASVLFFAISDLSLVDPMYQYSLGWFIQLYETSIENSNRGLKINERTVDLIDCITFTLYAQVCRSLFGKHTLMFAFLLCVKILQQDGQIDALEWRFVLAGGSHNAMDARNPASTWLTDKAWLDIMNLNRLENFQGFVTDFTNNIAHYKKIFDSVDAHLEPLDPLWEPKVSQFQRLCFLRCIRPDKIVPAVKVFITHHLDDRYVEPPPMDLKRCLQDSSINTPLIFILSAGADPMADLLKLAEESRFAKKFEKVSLGQGQGPKAERVLQLGMERGWWICLENCHLSTSWMPKLNSILQGISKNPQVHKDFRLWLTSMPTPDFPVAVLQHSIKMTMEPPQGLKANMLRSYNRFNDVYLNSCQAKPEEWKMMLWSLSLFHAVIQDRRKFGPLGWNKTYDFTDGDLSVCIAQIKMFLETYQDIPFAVIRFLCGEINYGGRVTEEQDRRLIKTLLDSFVTPEALHEGYKFSQAGTYFMPAPADVKSYLAAIADFPSTPHPEIFGLHENADITGAQNETNELFVTVLSMQPRAGATGAAGQREALVMNNCMDMVAKLPHEFYTQDVLHVYPTTYSESMNTVLVQECIRYNGLLAMITLSLKECLKALKGLVVMSPDLEDVATSVYNNQVPEQWNTVAYPSLKPLSAWMADLVERFSFIQKWIDIGLPKVYWISGFFFPQAFLTGTLQNYARKKNIPIDAISFDFKVMEVYDEIGIVFQPEDGCYIRGLFLEGARWNSKYMCLAESRAKELYSRMPIVWLNPMKDKPPPGSNVYNCPMYKTLTRHGILSTTGHSTNFIMYMDLPCDKPEKHWIARGVALFTSLK
mmetsp:Transcript_8605/g.16207  ORF Transcript_8605/g.16207 Transcript_8605/m.16207 type:complete len:872 (+) Transcript_8605:3-2618(+)